MLSGNIPAILKNSPQNAVKANQLLPGVRIKPCEGSPEGDQVYVIEGMQKFSADPEIYQVSIRREGVEDPIMASGDIFLTTMPDDTVLQTGMSRSRKPLTDGNDTYIAFELLK